ncbi:MAG: AbrB/MazE/SpoVT family DNA-binding domain-containing protein [Dethiobacter sp.]|nr:AbrB/MazE/SpoVT family DNA-binding domain-containing protein [Dethiobacter sp.]
MPTGHFQGSCPGFFLVWKSLQVTLPKEVMQELNLKVGDDLKVKSNPVV